MLDERKQSVLRAVIRDYVASAEPVGSRTVARRYGLGVSPATIRNEMADLEEQGFLEQPHTSAGRVPTDRGYRFYVDRLMDDDQARIEGEVLRVQALYRRKVREIESLIQQTGHLLADMTDYLSLILGPRLSRAVFHSLQIIPIRGQRAMLLIVTDNGLIENRLMNLPEEISEWELEKISRILTEHLKGLTLEQIGRDILRDLERDLADYRRLLDETLTVISEELRQSEEEKLYLGGTTNILKQPEFRDVEQLQVVLKALEEESVIQQLLAAEVAGNEVAVIIGHEIEHRDVQNCSLVTATYRIGDQTIGRIGVLGPKRMEYARVMQLVELVSRQLNRSLEEL